MIRQLMIAASLLATLFATTAQASEHAQARSIVENRCQVCHGIQGESSNAVYPRLAGQSAKYIAKQLADFQAGRRTGTMNEMVTGLTEEDMIALGRYFSDMPAATHNISDPDLAAVGSYIYHQGNRWSGVASCASCHGADGAGTDTLPRIAGQHMRYLVFQLQDFNTRERNNDNAVMHSIASKLTQLEIEAVARYMSGK